MKTLIITAMKMRVIDKDHCSIFSMNPRDYMGVDEDGPYGAGVVQEELIKANHYFRMSNDSRESWIVGFDKKTCEMLEILPTGEKEEFKSAKFKLAIIRDKVTKAEGATLWERIKWVFVGIKL